MEPLDRDAMRRLVRRSPEVGKLFQQFLDDLRINRGVGDPSLGDAPMAAARAEVERDAEDQTYRALADDPALAEQARLYDEEYARRPAPEQAR